MNFLKSLSILIFSMVFISCNGQDTNSNMSSDASFSKIEVLNFHSTHRCKTCNAIEANTKYTLETYFSEEMTGNKVTHQVINVDLSENEKMAEKFEAFGTALFLNVIKDGKGTQVNLTDFAFMKGNDKDAFSQELKAKIEKQLNTL